MTRRRLTATAAGAAVALALGLAVRAEQAATPTAPAPAEAAAARPAVSRPRPAAAPAASHTPGAVPLTAAGQTELVTTYCATCHSERAKAGGLSLANFTAMRAQEQPEVVEKIIRKLRAGMMPPAGAKRPDAATIDALTAALESRMDEHAATNPNPGWRPFQRLNRAEYTRAVRDLLGDRGRCHRLPAGRHHEPRLRQRRRRAGHVADADRRLHARGQPDQPARRGRPRRHAGRRHLQGAAARCRRCASSKARRWAPAAASS